MENVAKHYFSNTREEMVRFLPVGYHRVLEIGCGEGGFIDNLRPGSEAWGIEPNAEAAAVASTKFQHLLLGIYDDVKKDLPDEYFDLVICNDVIEHMPDTEDFFSSIRDKIALNGTIIGSIPNVRYATNLYALVMKGDWQYKDFGILDRTHLRFFTKKSLRHVLISQHFDIDRLAGINHLTKNMRSYKKLLFYIGIFLLNVFSFGKLQDIWFTQIGFCCQKKPSKKIATQVEGA